MSWFKSKEEIEREVREKIYREKLENSPEFLTSSLIEIKLHDQIIGSCSMDNFSGFSDSRNRWEVYIDAPLNYSQFKNLSQLKLFIDGVDKTYSVYQTDTNSWSSDGSYEYKMLIEPSYIKNLRWVEVRYKKDVQKERSIEQRNKLEQRIVKIFDKLGLSPEEFSDLKDYIHTHDGQGMNYCKNKCK